MKLIVFAYISLFGLLAGCDTRFDYEFYPTNEYLKEMKRCEQEIPTSKPSYNLYDIGPRLHEMGRPAEWKAQYKFLGNTCYRASVGPGFYQDQLDEDPDYYSIDIEVMQFEGSKDGTTRKYWSVLYQRDFKIVDLPNGFLHKNIQEIVSFDENIKVVRFLIGKGYEYKLP